MGTNKSRTVWFRKFRNRTLGFILFFRFIYHDLSFFYAVFSFTEMQVVILHTDLVHIPYYQYYISSRNRRPFLLYSSFAMPPKRGIKRQRSEGLSELASVVSMKTKAPAPKASLNPAAGPSKSKFTVFNDDPDEEQPHPPKKLRLDAPRLSLKSTNILNDVEISPIRIVPPPPTTTAPSLKNHSAFATLTHSQKEHTTPPQNNGSQRTRAMLLSPPTLPHNTNQGLSPTAFLTSRNQALTDNGPLKFLQPSLKSPFRPVYKQASRDTANTRLVPTIRRPSEGTALRRMIVSNENEMHRRPSDSSAYTRKPRALSFTKKITTPTHSKLNRYPSLLDALQQSVPRTPPNRFPVKSPSVIPSSDAGKIPPIPHMSMQVDTPTRDAEQLVADMSQFSLAPIADDIMSSPQKEPAASPKGDANSMVVDEVEMDYQPLVTQSSPGIEIPSVQDDSWCLPAMSHSSPIKSIVASSSDPLDMFHPVRFPPTGRRPRMSFQAEKAINYVAPVDTVTSPTKHVLRHPKVYGRRGGRKSVRFAKESGGIAKEEDETDSSEDEILLK